MTRAEWEAAKKRCEALAGVLSTLECAWCGDKHVVLTAFSNKQHAVVCENCWKKIQDALDMLGEAMALVIEYSNRRSGWTLTALDGKADALRAKWEGRDELEAR